MRSLVVESAEFVLGAAAIAQLPNLDRTELALIGRSNVGKSTLLNRLTGRKKLARVGKTPGRTQQLTLFDVRLSNGSELSLVDLPGFGYAKLSHSKRDELHELITEYLTHREPLKVVCLLNDCRRLPQEEELWIRDLCFNSGISTLIVLTKCDKLTKSELENQHAAAAGAFGLEKSDIVLSGEGISVSMLWERIAAFM